MKTVVCTGRRGHSESLAKNPIVHGVRCDATLENYLQWLRSRLHLQRSSTSKKSPEQWSRWIQRFERFRTASDLAGRDLRDAKLSEALQMDSDLILSRAIAKARQSEAVKGQQTVVRKKLNLEPEKPKEIEAAQVREKLVIANRATRKQAGAFPSSSSEDRRSSIAWGGLHLILQTKEAITRDRGPQKKIRQTT